MDYFEEGFCYREASWHRKETLLMRRLILPGDRDEAIRLAGHDFDVIEVPVANVGSELKTVEARNQAIEQGSDVGIVGGKWRTLDLRDEKKSLYIKQLREQPDGTFVPGPVHGNYLETVNDTWEIIPNSVGWDLLEAVAGEGAKLETGITLKGGAICVVTVYLDEPFQLPGDNSPILPYMAARWAHDGSGAMSVRSFMTRIVCWNTDGIAESEAKRLGTDFTFRHTKNWRDRVEDAKMAIRGIRVHAEEYRQLADELVDIHLSEMQRELFVKELLPAPPEAYTSDVVKRHIEEARAKVRGIFDSPTIPDEHKFTGWGARLAGVEYLDHLRGYRNSDTYMGRQLLRTEPAKASLSKLIKEVALS